MHKSAVDKSNGVHLHLIDLNQFHPKTVNKLSLLLCPVAISAKDPHICIRLSHSERLMQSDPEADIGIL